MANEIKRRKRRVLVTGLLAIAACGAGVVVQNTVHRHSTDDAFVAFADVGGRTAMYCGAFAIVDQAVAASHRDSREPAPGGAVGRSTDFIGLANALSATVGTDFSSEALSSAITTYTYALASLGAAINHGGSTDSVEDLYTLTEFSGQTVATLCPKEARAGRSMKSQPARDVASSTVSLGRGGR